MKAPFHPLRLAAIALCGIIAGGAPVLVAAQEAAAPAPGAGAALTAARQAIEVRKAIFVLIGANFRPVGETLQGKAAYDAEDIKKRSARLDFLAPLLNDAFPDNSSTGDTKSKPEIWSNRADFDRRLKEFQEHSAALVQVAAKETSNSDAFKAAASAVGKDCKSCHEQYRTK